MGMAENNNPSTISPTGTAQPAPVKITREPEPDMGVLEWAKKYIEIPEMKARMAGLTVQELPRPTQKKKPVTSRSPGQKAIPGTYREIRIPGNQVTEPKSVHTKSRPVLLADRKTELKCIDYHRKKARKMLEEQAKLLMFAHLDAEIARLRLMIDDLRYRLDDIEAGRRSQ